MELQLQTMAEAAHAHRRSQKSSVSSDLPTPESPSGSIHSDQLLASATRVEAMATTGRAGSVKLRKHGDKDSRLSGSSSGDDSRRGSSRKGSGSDVNTSSGHIGEKVFTRETKTVRVTLPGIGPARSPVKKTDRDSASSASSGTPNGKSGPENAPAARVSAPSPGRVPLTPPNNAAETARPTSNSSQQSGLPSNSTTNTATQPTNLPPSPAKRPDSTNNNKAPSPPHPPLARQDSFPDYDDVEDESPTSPTAPPLSHPPKSESSSRDESPEYQDAEEGSDKGGAVRGSSGPRSGPSSPVASEASSGLSSYTSARGVSANNAPTPTSQDSGRESSLSAEARTALAAHERAVAGRRSEESAMKREQERLDDILALCVEFQREQAASPPPTQPRPAPLSEAVSTLSSLERRSNIKTNGSLSRLSPAPPGSGGIADGGFQFPSPPDAPYSAPPAGTSAVPPSASHDSGIGMALHHMTSSDAKPSSARPAHLQTGSDARGVGGWSPESEHPHILALSERLRSAEMMPSGLNQLEKLQRDLMLSTGRNAAQHTNRPPPHNLPLSGNAVYSTTPGNSVYPIRASLRGSRLSVNYDDILAEACSGVSAEEQQGRLRHLRAEALQNIAGARQTISDIEAQENEAFRELEMERALLEGEHRTELDQLRGDRSRITHLQRRQLLAIDDMVAHRQQELEELELARQRLFSLEAELTSVLRGAGPDEPRAAAELREAVEAQRRLYEDLEFQQLEIEAKHEEERDRLQQQLEAEHGTLLGRFRETEGRLESLDSQQSAMVDQVRDEVSRLERERHGLVETLRREKNRLAAVERRLRQLGISSSGAPATGTFSQEEAQQRLRGGDLDPFMVATPPLGRRDDPGENIYDNHLGRAPTANGGVIGGSSTVSWAPEPRAPLCADEDSSSLPGSEATPSTDREISVSSSDEYMTDRHGSDSAPPNGAPSWRKQARPLTRYMPVRVVAFDLKQHVESNGHALDACPHVTINSTTCRGYLYKMGNKIKSWKKRWFVFDRTVKSLMYYPDKSETRPKGGVLFQALSDVYRDYGTEHHVLCMKTHERMYRCRAPSEEALRIWLDVLATGAEGHPDFWRQSFFPQDDEEEDDGV